MRTPMLGPVYTWRGPIAMNRATPYLSSPALTALLNQDLEAWLSTDQPAKPVKSAANEAMEETMGVPLLIYVRSGQRPVPSPCEQGAQLSPRCPCSGSRKIPHRRSER